MARFLVPILVVLVSGRVLADETKNEELKERIEKEALAAQHKMRKVAGNAFKEEQVQNEFEKKLPTKLRLIGRINSIGSPYSSSSTVISLDGFGCQFGPGINSPVGPGAARRDWRKHWEKVKEMNVGDKVTIEATLNWRTKRSDYLTRVLPGSFEMLDCGLVDSPAAADKRKKRPHEPILADEKKKNEKPAEKVRTMTLDQIQKEILRDFHKAVGRSKKGGRQQDQGK